MPAARIAASIGGSTCPCTTRSRMSSPATLKPSRKFCSGKSVTDVPGAFDAVGGDDQIGGAAADVDAGDPQSSAVGTPCRAASAVTWKKRARVAAEIARHLGVEIDELGAGGLVPVGQHARRGRGGDRRASSPASSTRGRARASARLRKIRRSASGMPVGKVSTMRRRRRGTSAWARRAALLRRVDQGERLQKDLGQHEGHRSSSASRAARTRADGRRCRPSGSTRCSARPSR